MERDSRLLKLRTDKITRHFIDDLIQPGDGINWGKDWARYKEAMTPDPRLMPEMQRVRHEYRILEEALQQDLNNGQTIELLYTQRPNPYRASYLEHIRERIRHKQEQLSSLRAQFPQYLNGHIGG
jgi:hypothetical protein